MLSLGSILEHLPLARLLLGDSMRHIHEGTLLEGSSHADEAAELTDHTALLRRRTVDDHHVGLDGLVRRLLRGT